MAIDWSQPPNPSLPSISQENIGEVEKEALAMANKAISLLEQAIAAWDNAKDKPPELKETIQRYRRFHEALSDWEKRMLQSMGKADFNARVRMLEEFVRISKSYEVG